MGIFGGNKEELLHKLGQLESRVELLQIQNNELKQEKIDLQFKIGNLQDAVVAIKSPQAYRMMQDDKLVREWDDNGTKPQIPGEDETMRAYQQMTGLMEGTIIRSADDLFSLLGRSQGVPVHGPLGDPKES